MCQEQGAASKRNRLPDGADRRWSKADAVMSPRHLPSGIFRHGRPDVAGRAQRPRADGRMRACIGQPGKPWSVRQAMLVATFAGLLVWLLIFLGFRLIAF